METSLKTSGQSKIMSIQQGKRFYIYIPSRMARILELKKGNIVNITIENAHPEYVEPARRNFFPKAKKKEDDSTEIDEIDFV